MIENAQVESVAFQQLSPLIVKRRGNTPFGSLEMSGQTDSVSEKLLHYWAGSSSGSVEGRFSRPLATSD